MLRPTTCKMSLDYDDMALPGTIKERAIVTMSSGDDDEDDDDFAFIKTGTERKKALQELKEKKKQRESTKRLHEEEEEPTEMVTITSRQQRRVSAKTASSADSAQASSFAGSSSMAMPDAELEFEDAELLAKDAAQKHAMQEQLRKMKASMDLGDDDDDEVEVVSMCGGKNSSSSSSSSVSILLVTVKLAQGDKEEVIKCKWDEPLRAHLVLEAAKRLGLCAAASLSSLSLHYCVLHFVPWSKSLFCVRARAASLRPPSYY